MNPHATNSPLSLSLLLQNAYMGDWYESVRQDENWMKFRQKVDNEQFDIYIKWLNLQYSRILYDKTGPDLDEAKRLYSWLMITDLQKDLEDGLRFLYLLEILYDTSLSKEFGSKKLGCLKLHKMRNHDTCIKFIKNEIKLKCVGLNPVDLANGNMKMLTGLLFLLKHDFESRLYCEQFVQASQKKLNYLRNDPNATTELKIDANNRLSQASPCQRSPRDITFESLYSKTGTDKDAAWQSNHFTELIDNENYLVKNNSINDNLVNDYNFIGSKNDAVFSWSSGGSNDESASKRSSLNEDTLFSLSSDKIESADEAIQDAKEEKLDDKSIDSDYDSVMVTSKTDTEEAKTCDLFGEDQSGDESIRTEEVNNIGGENADEVKDVNVLVEEPFVDNENYLIKDQIINDLFISDYCYVHKSEDVEFEGQVSLSEVESKVGIDSDEKKGPKSKDDAENMPVVNILENDSESIVEQTEMKTDESESIEEESVSFKDELIQTLESAGSILEEKVTKAEELESIVKLSESSADNHIMNVYDESESTVEEKIETCEVSALEIVAAPTVDDLQSGGPEANVAVYESNNERMYEAVGYIGLAAEESNSSIAEKTETNLTILPEINNLVNFNGLKSTFEEAKEVAEPTTKESKSIVGESVASVKETGTSIVIVETYKEETCQIVEDSVQYAEIDDENTEESKHLKEVNVSIHLATDTKLIVEQSVPSSEEKLASVEEPVPFAEETHPSDKVSMPSTEEKCHNIEESVSFAEETNPSVEESVPFAEETYSSVEESVSFAEETNPSVEESVPFAEETYPSVEESVSFAEETYPSVEESVPFAEETYPSVEESVQFVEETNPSIEISAPSAVEKLESVKESVPSDEKTTQSFEVSVASPEEKFQTVEESLPITEVTYPSDEESMPSPGEKGPSVRESVPSDEETHPSVELSVASAEEKCQTVEQSLPIAEETHPNVECSVPSAEAIIPIYEASEISVEEMDSVAERSLSSAEVETPIASVEETCSTIHVPFVPESRHFSETKLLSNQQSQSIIEEPVPAEKLVTIIDQSEPTFEEQLTLSEATELIVEGSIVEEPMSYLESTMAKKDRLLPNVCDNEKIKVEILSQITCEFDKKTTKPCAQDALSLVQSKIPKENDNDSIQDKTVTKIVGTKSNKKASRKSKIQPNKTSNNVLPTSTDIDCQVTLDKLTACKSETTSVHLTTDSKPCSNLMKVEEPILLDKCLNDTTKKSKKHANCKSNKVQLKDLEVIEAQKSATATVALDKKMKVNRIKSLAEVVVNEVQNLGKVEDVEISKVDLRVVNDLRKKKSKPGENTKQNVKLEKEKVSKKPADFRESKNFVLKMSTSTFSALLSALVLVTIGVLVSVWQREK